MKCKKMIYGSATLRKENSLRKHTLRSKTPLPNITIQNIVRKLGH